MNCLAAHHSDTLLAAECRAKLHEYTARQVTDFRLNPALAAACAADIVNSSCGALRLGGGQVLGCLLEREEQLTSADCRQHVAKMGRLVTAEAAFNTPLFHACAAQLADGGLCARGVLGLPAAPAPANGALLSCLKHNASRLEGSCATEVAKLMATQARDVLYNPRLVRACGYEMHEPRFCGGVEHGGGAVLACLEERRPRPGFSFKCAAEVLEEQQLHAADIGLMVALRRACKPELSELCGYDHDHANWTRLRTQFAPGATGWGVGSDGDMRLMVAPIATCLRTQPMASLKSAACKARVRSLQLAASEDISLNPRLDAACAAEQAQLCASVPRGGGRRIACLEAAARRGGAGSGGGRANFSAPCHEALLAFQSNALVQVRGHWPLVSACATEMETFCAAALEGAHGVGGGGGKGGARGWGTTVLGCLQGSTNRAGFGPDCLGAVKAATAVQLSDMRADSLQLWVLGARGGRQPPCVSNLPPHIHVQARRQRALQRVCGLRRGALPRAAGGGGGRRRARPSRARRADAQAHLPPTT